MHIQLRKYCFRQVISLVLLSNVIFNLGFATDIKEAQDNNVTTSQLICKQCADDAYGKHCELTWDFHSWCLDPAGTYSSPINETVWVVDNDFCAEPTLPMMGEKPSWVADDARKPGGYPEGRTPSPQLSLSPGGRSDGAGWHGPPLSLWQLILVIAAILNAVS